MATAEILEAYESKDPKKKIIIFRSKVTDIGPSKWREIGKDGHIRERTEYRLQPTWQWWYINENGHTRKLTETYLDNGSLISNNGGTISKTFVGFDEILVTPSDFWDHSSGFWDHVREEYFRFGSIPLKNVENPKKLLVLLT